jgi:hypothetical protein
MGGLGQSVRGRRFSMVGQQRVVDVGERGQLLAIEHIDHVFAHALDVRGRCGRQDVGATRGEPGGGAAGVVGDRFPGHQAAFLHSGDLMREPALRPLQLGGQIGEGQAVIRLAGEMCQHRVFDVGEVRLAGRVAPDRRGDEVASAHEAEPRAHFDVIEPMGIGHDSAPNYDVSCKLSRALGPVTTCQN